MRYKKHNYTLYYADKTYFNFADMNLLYTFSIKNIYV